MSAQTFHVTWKNETKNELMGEKQKKKDKEEKSTYQFSLTNQTTNSHLSNAP